MTPKAKPRRLARAWFAFSHARTWGEIRRLKWLIGIALGGVFLLDVLRPFGELSKWALVVYSLCKASFVLMALHFVRGEMFPYVDISEAYRDGTPMSKAVIIAAVLLSMAIIFSGAVSGV